MDGHDGATGTRSHLVAVDNSNSRDYQHPEQRCSPDETDLVNLSAMMNGGGRRMEVVEVQRDNERQKQFWNNVKM
jgi:hypothetical protein